MPNYTSSGAENLRADAKVYAGETKSSPSAKGQDAGGDKTDAKVKSGGSKSTPGGKGTKKPSGVQTYDDEAT